MKRTLACWLGLVAVSQLSAAEWNKLTSSNFELYTTAGEHDARQTVELFEQVRAFFMKVKSSNVTTRLPVTIVGFRNPKDYKPYTLSEAAAAYYVGDEQHDYIVMSSLGLENAPMAIHEYMHLLVRHSGLKMPIWLNEGFADVYSTLKPVGDQILLGSVPPGRGVSLSREKWLPLPSLFAVGHDSPEYNEKTRAGIFYAESWLLTHMLVLGNGYRNQFSAFAAQLSSSGSTEDAFFRVYGKTVPQVQADLDAYYHSNSLTGVLFKTQFEKITVGELQPATDLEIGLTLAKLVGLTGHPEDATRRLDALASAHPDDYQVEESLAYLEWRKGNLNAARQHFQRASEHGATSWKTYWDYARLLGAEPGKTEETVVALRQALHFNPGLTDAQLMLGSELYQTKSYAQALVAFRQVKQVDAKQASRMFLMMAFSALQLKMNEDAKRYAVQAMQYAQQPSETDSAQRLIQYLDQSKTGPPPATVAVAAAPPGEAPEDSVEASRPLLRRRDAETTSLKPLAASNPNLTAKGRLTQLDCLNGPARMHIDSGGMTYSLLIRNPNQVAIRNKLGAAVEMTCGRQNLPVTVEYRPLRDDQYDTGGDVQAIEFGRP